MPKQFSLPPSAVEKGGTDFDRVSPARYDAAFLRTEIERVRPNKDDLGPYERALDNAVVWLLKKIEDQE